MSDDGKLKVVLCWHMHQPEYRDLSSGAYRLPWTYLHAIKDYVDMAAHLEATPEAKAVVNFVPTLLEQIDDYAKQVEDFLQGKGVLRDPLLAALYNPVMPPESDLRRQLVRSCLRVNHKTVIARFDTFARLVEIANWLETNQHAYEYVSEQYLVDIVVWYHLGWIGETVRRTDNRVKRLMEKDAHFTLHDRHELMVVISELLSGVIDRYRALAQRGQVELAMTPYAHPIAPLLLDIQSARDAMPDVLMPSVAQYPGGEERMQRHIDRGKEVFKRYFGFVPKGCWPAEGSVSELTLRLLEKNGYTWAATGANVLANTLARYGVHSDFGVHQAYRMDQGKLNCFFRDDGLSDLIGFTYSDWHADDAVGNFIHHLEQIADASSHCAETTVSIILDGENAWEYYPENGYYFLSTLYRKLSAHPRLQLTTYSEALGQGVRSTELPGLVAGSWVYGTFSTWIGDPDKNRGWDMLADAKRCYDKVAASGKLSASQLDAADLQLSLCEGSDWFWWFGDYNPSDSVSDFERMFRTHLAHLYQVLGEEPPEYLSHSFSQGSGAPAMGGTMRPGQSVS